jgi:hypothetical protein
MASFRSTAPVREDLAALVAAAAAENLAAMLADIERHERETVAALLAVTEREGAQVAAMLAAQGRDACNAATCRPKGPRRER